MEMENLQVSSLFSRIKTVCGQGVARCFVTGVTPLALNEFNIATHITHDLRFALLYGFTEADLRSGLARLPPQLSQPEVVKRIVESWRRDHKGYYFDPRQKVALYNPTRVLHGLCQLEQALIFDPLPPPLRAEHVAEYLLNRIRSYPNSMPAEATMEAIKFSPNASVVLAEALASDGAELECARGVSKQFRLLHMHELVMGRTPLLALMFYTSALTYARSVPGSRELKCSLRIPNNVARKEFAVGLQKMIGLDDFGLDQPRGGIAAMVDEKQVEPFCHAVPRFLLSGLVGRDVLGGEGSLLTRCVYATSACFCG